MTTNYETATQTSRYSHTDRRIMAWVIAAVYSPLVLLIGAGAAVI